MIQCLKNVDLESIYIEIHPPAAAATTAALSAVTQKIDLNTIPRPQITAFDGDGALLYSDNSMLYIMHKFPPLNTSPST
jgi:hypothetical protein